MTAFSHPATTSVPSVGAVDRVVYRVGTAMVRWSTRRTDRTARRGSTLATAVHVRADQVDPALRHAVLADRADREHGHAVAAAVLLPRR
ncbi:hypothetical protein [Curtobacterium sp. RRHDQ10]|uniref:hypothetical protein n=1 Tax=Curtobacterium phyllosphaerae TaxID=3413379 RepID=UPI003BF24BCE